jgi:4'-phosphopantetheinyl transferase
MVSSQNIEIPSWTPALSAPRLLPGGLHLWKINCEAQTPALDALWPVLSQQERKRAKGMRVKRHRERYVRAHAGLRRILSTYININPNSIEFLYGDQGKPRLAHRAGQPLEFNLTTSANLALVAVTRDCAVGVDCEWIRPRRELERIASRVFDPQALRALELAPEQDRLEIFYNAWTALEASVKADGRGLFRRRNMPPMAALDIVHCIPGEGFIAAVAGEGLPPSSGWRTLALRYR